jgi:hypothetical protein
MWWDSLVVNDWEYKLRKRPQVGDGYGKCIARKRSLVRGQSEDKFFTGNVKSWPVHGLCGRQCIFSDCLSSLQKWTILKTSCLINYNVLQNTLIFVGECSVLRFKVSSALKLLGNSSVGVMDPQNHCAVVTLVVSNCLKKLMSHSCPSSYFVLLRYAGTGTRCRRTRKRCRDSWTKYICQRHEFKR